MNSLLPADALPPVPVSQMVAEVEREIAVRRKVYPGWIAAGKLKESEAADRIRNMEAVAETLRSQGSRAGRAGVATPAAPVKEEAAGAPSNQLEKVSGPTEAEIDHAARIIANRLKAEVDMRAAGMFNALVARVEDARRRGLTVEQLRAELVTDGPGKLGTGKAEGDER